MLEQQYAIPSREEEVDVKERSNKREVVANVKGEADNEDMQNDMEEDGDNMLMMTGDSNAHYEIDPD